MQRTIERMLAGEPFNTQERMVRIVGSIGSGSGSDDEVLLIASGDAERADSFTTLQALALAVETGRWSLVSTGRREAQPFRRAA